jgi:hypothetical protein
MSSVVEQVDGARSEMERTNRAFVDAFNAGDFEKGGCRSFLHTLTGIDTTGPEL